MAKSGWPKKVLFLSDAHIAGRLSNMPAYQASLLAKMSEYDHVVMIGDCWELFWIDKNHVRLLSDLLETLTGISHEKWAKEFSKKETWYSSAKNVIRGSRLFTEQFLELFPSVSLHFIGGNHEGVRKFHNMFRKLQEKHEDPEFQADKLSRFITSNALAPAQKMEFLTAFNAMSAEAITPENFDRIDLKAALTRRCDRYPAEGLGRVFKKTAPGPER